MSSNFNLQQGLSEAEIDTLAQRLAANSNREALSLEAVDGLFCALIASPRAVMPHEYLPVILGGNLGEAGMLGELADVQELMGLLMRYWNSIARDFAHETVHLAYVEENGVDAGDALPSAQRATAGAQRGPDHRPSDRSNPSRYRFTRGQSPGRTQI